MKSRCAFSLCLILLFFACFAGESFAQNLEFLADKITRGNTEEKREALRQIRNLETPEASLKAVPALRDSAEIVRATAAFSVIYLPKDEAFSVLLPLLSDKKELVRREAAYALGKVRNPSAVNPLLQILQKDKITEVRNAAAVALGEIGDVSAVDALTRVLQRRPRETDEFLRRSAARSIGQIAQIIQTDKAKVLTPENFLPEQYKSTGTPQYTKLVEQFPVFSAAVNVLIQTLRGESESADAKREAAFALGAIGDEAAVPILQANLNNPDYYLVEISKESLRKIRISFDSKNPK